MQNIGKTSITIFLASLVATACVFTFQAQAQTPDEEKITWSGHTVGDLVDSCKTALADEEKKSLDCERYLDGVLDGHMVSVATTGQLLFCLPPNQVSKAEIMQLFIAFAERHPETFHEPASVTLLALLKSLFPCHS